MNTDKKIDILCVGEILIDFIGHQENVNIDNTRDYHRYLGGSPTNVSMNCNRLGLNAKLVSTIGKDGFGSYILKRLTEAQLNTNGIQQLTHKPTSVIFVSKSTGTPDFIPYRSADFEITDQQIPTKTLQNTTIFHTTCFALSKNPAQTTILNKAKEAAALGCTLSIDINYAKELWASKADAIAVIEKYCSLNPLIKISEDDMQRYFDKDLSHDAIFNYFHNLGVATVCLTLGGNGVKLSTKNEGVISLPAIKIDKIVDTTGAGDAFWSGFLFAHINNKPKEDCLKIALKLAALKLQNVGRLPESINIVSQLF